MTGTLIAPAPPTSSKPPRQRLRAVGSGLRELWGDKAGFFGLVLVIAFVVVAVLAPVLTPHDPSAQVLSQRLKPPFWESGGSMNHILGTDQLGRDILSRVIYGSRISLLVGVSVVAVAMTFGTVMGVVAGYRGGRVDTVIMRIMDVILAFPSLLLALVLVAILGPGLVNAMIATAIVLQPHFARLTRASVMAEKNREYVVSARLAGAGAFRLMLLTILPNCLAPLIVQATLSFSNAILEAAALGFLGMGAQPPTPEWGTMLADARQYILRASWVVTFPGLCILITVLAINLIGDGLRDALDPKLKRS